MTVLLTIIFKMFRRLFWFAIGIGSYSFFRVFDGISLKKIEFCIIFSRRDICKRKKCSKHFQYDGKWYCHSYRLFILSITKTIRRGEKEFNHTAFMELFTAHLLKKNWRFYHLPISRGICETKKGSKKMSFFCLIHFLYLKLYLMFKVNIPKDVARSGLCCYIYSIKK